MRTLLKTSCRILTGVLLGIVLIAASTSAWAQSSEKIEQQIEDLRQQLRVIEASRQILTEQTIDQRQKRDAMQEDINTIENFKRLPNQALSTANLLLRRAEQLVARALSPLEKARAFDKYEASEKTVEDFITLFRTMRGQPPDRTDISQRGIILKILEIEQRNLFVSDIAEPLAIAGKLITKIAQGVAIRQGLVNAGILKNVKQAKSQYRVAVGLKITAETTADLTVALERASTRIREAKKAFGVESADVSAMLAEVKAINPDEINALLSNATSVLDEDATDGELLLIMDMAEDNPEFEASIDRLERAQNDFNALANQLAGKVKVGRQGFLENVGQSVIVKKLADPIMESARNVVATLGPLQSRVNKLSNKYLKTLRPIQSALDTNEAALLRLADQANQVEQQIFELGQARTLAQFKEQKIDNIANPVLTSLNVRLRGQRAISTDRFGELIGLKNNTLLDVSVSIGSLENQTCRHSCKRDDQGRQTCQRAERKRFVRRDNVSLDFASLSRFGLKADPNGVLRLSNENGLSVIRARGFGRGTVEVTGKILKQIEKRKHVCGTEDVVVEHEVRQATPEISVSKVDTETFSVNGLTAASAKILGRLDFFTVGARRVGLGVFVDGPDGRRRTFPINGGVVTRVSDDRDVADINANRQSLDITATGQPGLMTVEVETAIKPGGKAVPIGEFLVAFTRFTDDVEFPEGPWALDNDRFLPPGQTIEFFTQFEGGADPDLLSVDWRLSGTRVDQLVKRGGERFGGSNTATLRAAFDKQKVFKDGDDFEGIFRNRNIAATGVVSYQGREVYRTENRVFIIGQPILERAQIGLRSRGGGFVPVKRRDFITPTVRGDANLGQVAIQGTFDGGVQKFIPLSRFDRIISGSEELIRENGEINLESLGTLNGEISKSSTAFTAHRYEALLGPARQRGYYVIGRDIEDQFAVSVNKLLLERGEDITSRLVRARVVGPGTFVGFSAIFDAGGDPITVPLTNDGEDQIAEVEVPPLSLESVTIVNGAGVAVAKLITAIHGQPLGKLKIALDHPPSAKPGQIVVVSAQILNIESKGIESNGVQCEWTTNPDIGTFDQDVTRLEPLTITTGFCVNVLRVSENLPGGRAVDLPVNLALIQGAR